MLFFLSFLSGSRSFCLLCLRLSFCSFLHESLSSLYVAPHSSVVPLVLPSQRHKLSSSLYIPHHCPRFFALPPSLVLSGIVIQFLLTLAVDISRVLSDRFHPNPWLVLFSYHYTSDFKEQKLQLHFWFCYLAWKKKQIEYPSYLETIGKIADHLCFYCYLNIVRCNVRKPSVLITNFRFSVPSGRRKCIHRHYVSKKQLS